MLKFQHHRHSLLAALLACALALAAPAARAQVSLEFDFSAPHEFLGFGAQVWLSNKNTQASTQMLKDLNARFVRVSLVPKVPFSQLKAGQTVEQYSALIQANDSAEQRARFTAFRDQMKSLNINPVLIFWRMPEPWVNIQTRKAGSKGKATFAKPEFIGDYANLVVAQILYSTKLGIAPAAVELVNEPHGAWSTKIPPESYANLVLKARAALDKQGLQAVRIAGPGVGLREFDHYIGGMVKAGAAQSIGFASAHIYALPAVLADTSRPGMASFVGRGKFGPVMVTEFGLKNDKDHSEEGADGISASSPEFALASAADAVQLLNHGASALIYWQLQSFEWEKKTHGIMSESGERRPVAHALQALFSKLPPGAKVGRLQAAAPGLYAAALQAEGRSYLMLANLSGQPQTLSAKWRGGLESCGQEVEVSGWLPTGAGAGAVQATRSANCELKGTLAKDGVATVVLR